MKVLFSSILFIFLFLSAFKVSAQTPTWDYVYNANNAPEKLPTADAWTREVITKGKSSRTIMSGQFHVNTSSRFQYVRRAALDPSLNAGELTIEVRGKTDSAPTWGLVVGNVFQVGAGRSSVSIWILNNQIKIEHRNPRPIFSPLDSVEFEPGYHTFRIVRSVSAGQIRIFIDGTQVWNNGLGTASSGFVPPEIVMFYGENTITHLDYLAYTVGAYDPTVLSSPLPPYRLPFYGTFKISQGPGCGTHTTTSQMEAIDFAVPEGTPIHAAATGTIAFAGTGKGQNAGFGEYVRIDHSDGSRSYYAHLSYVAVSSGSVQKGDLIGVSGNSGKSTGPHLHFHVLDSGSTAVPIRTMEGITWASGDPENPCAEDAEGDNGIAEGPGL